MKETTNVFIASLFILNPFFHTILDIELLKRGRRINGLNEEKAADEKASEVAQSISIEAAE